LTFAVDERYFYSSIERMEKAKLMQNIITSNQPLYIKHLPSIFEQMWWYFHSHNVHIWHHCWC